MLLRIRTQLTKLPEVDYNSHNTPVYMFPVRLQDLPANIPTEINPRSPSRQKDTYRSIVRSLMNPYTPEVAPFFQANCGMHTSAMSIRFERSGTGAIFAVVDYDPMNSGLFNGHHTYLAILDTRDQEDFTGQEQNVKFFVNIGLSKEQVIDMAEKNNFTHQVRDFSIENARGAFDWLDGVLRSVGVRENFKFEEGETGGMTVADALRVLIVADQTGFPTDVKRSERTYPVNMYKSHASVFTYYKRNVEHIKRMSTLVPFLFGLAAKIYREADNQFRVSREELYGTTNKKKQAEQPVQIPYAKPGLRVNRFLHRGVFLPILGAVRMFIGTDYQLRASQSNIMLAFTKALPLMLDKMVDLKHPRKGQVLPIDNLGADPYVWKTMFEIVEETAADMGLVLKESGDQEAEG